MAVIKSVRADHLTHDAVVLDLGDLKRQAEAILREAREQAQQIVAAGRHEARKLTDAADARGHSQGFERGRMEGHESGRVQATEAVLAELTPQVQSLVEKWTAAVDRWDAERAEMLMQAQEDVLAFAVALATRIIHRTIETDPSTIREQLAEALAVLARPTASVVRINPADRPTLELALQGILNSIANAREISLHDDPGITRGGCIVCTEGGQIDATIEKQLERVVDSLLPMRSVEHPLRRPDPPSARGPGS